jgi:hypothetical protein
VAARDVSGRNVRNENPFHLWLLLDPVTDIDAKDGKGQTAHLLGGQELRGLPFNVVDGSMG